MENKPPAHAPAEFQRAWIAADDSALLHQPPTATERLLGVRRCIEALARADSSLFLVREATWSAEALTRVRALAALELVGDSTSRGNRSLPGVDHVGPLSSALTEPCPRCHALGYLVCFEYADHKFDPDWHSELSVLCLRCPVVTFACAAAPWHSPLSRADG